MIKQIYILVVVAALLLSACAKVPGSLDGQPLQRLTPLDDSQLFASSGDGLMLAYNWNGLQLRNAGSGNSIKISERSPEFFAWSPDNMVLATLFPSEENQTRLVQYDSNGQSLYERLLPVTASSLAWSARGDLLVTGYRLEVYSFGANLQQVLFSVDNDSVKKIILSDTTLKPGLAKALRGKLSHYQPVYWNDLGDEFFYVSVHDPPEFPPYLNLYTYNWQAREKKLLHKLPLQEISLDRGPHDDSVFVEQEQGNYIAHSWESSEDLKTSEHSVYYFKGGRLLSGDHLLADWGPGSRLQILDDGRYLLAADGYLYMGDGLRPEAETQYSEAIWTLRRWRAAGLITHDEYLEKLKDVE